MSSPTIPTGEARPWILSLEVRFAIKTMKPGTAPGPDFPTADLPRAKVCQEYRLPLVLTFVDYEQTFDNVEMDEILSTLADQGVDASYVRTILCLDALLQIHLFTLPGFRLNCRVEESNECYQHLCRLVNKHSTSECPGICRFTAAEYYRISAVGLEEGGRMPSEICMNPAWITTATPTPTTTEATMRLRAARSIPNFRDLYMDSTACKRLCEKLFNRIVKRSSSCTPRNDRRCFFESCQGVIGSVAATDDYNECPSICDSMSNGMHYLHLPVLLTLNEVRNICKTLHFQEKAREPQRATGRKSAVTYPKKEVSDCTELCETVLPETLKPFKYFCPDGGKKYNPCVLSSCKGVINGTLMYDGQDAKDACSKLCSSMACAMRGRNMDKQQFGEEQIRKLCLEIAPSVRTSKPPRTTAVTYPYKEFSNCEELCVYVFPRTLKPFKYFCPDGGKKYNPCVLSSCKEVINGTLMYDGQDAKDACSKLCSSMACAMSGRNMDRQHCKELCEIVLPKTLKSHEHFCQDGGKNYNPCVLSSCKEVIHRTVMDDGRDPNDACPKMCLSMAASMLGRNMNRRLYGKKNFIEFCSKNLSSGSTAKSPITTAIQRTYPKEKFSNCKELCEIVLPKTLKSHEHFCQDGGKNYNPCVLSSCKEVIHRTVMDDGRDPNDACSKLCSSMAAAMLGRNMDRRLFGKEYISEFCSSIDHKDHYQAFGRYI
ncbi:hypothetical protein RB195_017427 [Necator americanus]|uniref:Kunitz/Bovine pancreatic trypsin inhibitor domain protein n=1 Tax=Necator americanus TaxID=51031 RepID=A0ABR1C6R1_NECAM